MLFLKTDVWLPLSVTQSELANYDLATDCCRRQWFPVEEHSHSAAVRIGNCLHIQYMYMYLYSWLLLMNVAVNRYWQKNIPKTIIYMCEPIRAHTVFLKVSPRKYLKCQKWSSHILVRQKHSITGCQIGIVCLDSYCQISYNVVLVKQWRDACFMFFPFRRSITFEPNSTLHFYNIVGFDFSFGSVWSLPVYQQHFLAEYFHKHSKVQ